MKSAAVPVLSACAFLIVSFPALAAQGTRSCGAGAIRAAAAKQVAPRLVGCRYDDVAVPLAQYFAIYPSLTKTPGDDASSTILQQTPAAGEPLAAGGQLALQVSVGPARSPQAAETPAAPPSTDTPSTEAPMTETPVIETPVADAQADLPPPVQKAPVKDAAPAVSAEAPTSEPKAAEAPRNTRPKFAWPKLSMPKLDVPKFHLPEITLPKLTFPGYLLRPDLAWAWIGTALVGVLLFFVWRGRRPRSEITYDRVPQVSARFVFGPSRLSASGPLVMESGGHT
ncbi:hypothetical protein [Asticcacaulis taihuensis]|jgi:hypothetical protein|uniref:PASTA domain-containing protein n=1 Tax=Asticcacaulis taihuensis TaxID=260084 RepID=A0A1G4TE43_9CAUL|nr:hypothetical protein [Asticcacaulis taihuensis]SCW78859.1 hypothetical protein SAMN02927928_3425 [Asticcacaulis taihuensis]